MEYNNLLIIFFVVVELLSQGVEWKAHYWRTEQGFITIIVQLFLADVGLTLIINAYYSGEELVHFKYVK